MSDFPPVDPGNMHMPEQDDLQPAVEAMKTAFRNASAATARGVVGTLYDDFARELLEAALSAMPTPERYSHITGFTEDPYEEIKRLTEENARLSEFTCSVCDGLIGAEKHDTRCPTVCRCHGAKGHDGHCQMGTPYEASREEAEDSSPEPQWGDYA